MTPYFYLKFPSFFTSNLQWLIYKDYQFNKAFKLAMSPKILLSFKIIRN